MMWTRPASNPPSRQGHCTIGFAAGNRGTGLLEVLASAALLGVLLSICLQLFVTSNRIIAVNALSLDRLDGIRSLDTAFRASVRGAVEAVDAAGPYAAAHDQLVLRLPASDGQSRYAVWSAQLNEDRLTLLEFSPGDPPNIQALRSLPLPVSRVSFDRSGGVIRLAYQLRYEEGERVPGNARTYTVLATPRAKEVTQ